MSHENVELVRRMLPRPQDDLVALFSEEGSGGPLARGFASFCHTDCECTMPLPDAEGITYRGLAEWRAGWRDWLAPWASYRSEVEDLVDAGDHVVVLVRDYGRRAHSAAEVLQIAAAVWTVREGKIARVVFYARRHEAFAAAGLRR